MRKLLIVDPSLLSLEGHSYNYDLAIAQAATRRFDEVVVYADREFRDASARMRDCRPVLNRLRIDTLKRCTNAVFHLFGRRARSAASVSAHATVVPGVWDWMVRLAEWLRARDLEWSLRSILRDHQRQGDDVHVFVQHAHFSELILAARLEPGAHIHLVLRYSPELVNAGQLPKVRFAGLLATLNRSRTLHLYTDSERLSAEYAALGAKRIRTLPVPILVPDNALSHTGADALAVRVAILGSARVEKGFCELAPLIERFPKQAGGRPVTAMIQTTPDSADPRVREALRELNALAARLPAGSLELLASPVPVETYYSWLGRAGIVALPYLSRKYNASTSGIFVEALCFGVPVICPADSWMADVLAEAEHGAGLRIGEVVSSIAEVPAAVEKIGAALPEYRAAVREFATAWRRTHNADACVKVLLEATAEE
jgi:glycosyltransferase involved in cell wall biosynthesis